MLGYKMSETVKLIRQLHNLPQITTIKQSPTHAPITHSQPLDQLLQLPSCIPVAVSAAQVNILNPVKTNFTASS